MCSRCGVQDTVHCPDCWGSVEVMHDHDPEYLGDAVCENPACGWVGTEDEVESGVPQKLTQVNLPG